MDIKDERTRQDWGGYPPETQKALRFVANMADKGMAKQVAIAIDREFVKREESQPMQMQKRSSRKKSAIARHKALTEDDFRLMIASFRLKHPGIDDRQADFMLRVHLRMQKDMPGWTL